MAEVEVGKEYFFTPDEFRERLTRVRQAMTLRGIDLLLSSEPENIFYVAGHQTLSFSSYQMVAVPLQGEPFLILRHLESIQARRLSWIPEIVTWDDTDDPVAVTVEALRQRKLIGQRVGIEERSLFLQVSTWKRLKDAIARLEDASGIVESCRAVKSPAELAYMREAARLTDLGMQAAMQEIGPGASENDVAAAAFDAMTRAGSEWLAKDPIVTSGDRAGIPHTTYHRRVLADHDTVLLEFSGVYHRYFSPLMRTAWIGKPDASIERLAAICVEGLEAALAAIRPGVTVGEVDAACLAIINREGLWENYRKRTGYSVGTGFLSWMEVGIATLRINDPTVLEPGMCFHLPVAVRLYGKAGIGLSETVRVTPNGVEILGRFPRELFRR